MLTEEKIIPVLKRRIKNLIADDLISPLFWDDFARELIALQGEEKELSLLGTSEPDKTKVYFSPSHESLSIFINNEWRVYHRRPKSEEPVKSQGEERRLTDEQLPLHQCLYSKATKCNLADPCLGCETRADVIGKTTLTDVDLREIDQAREERK